MLFAYMLYKLKTIFCSWIWTTDLNCTLWGELPPCQGSGLHTGVAVVVVVGKCPPPAACGSKMLPWIWCCRVLRSWHWMVPRQGQAQSVCSWCWRCCSHQALILRGVHGQTPWFEAVWGCQSASLGLLKGHSPWPVWVLEHLKALCSAKSVKIRQ